MMKLFSYRLTVLKKMLPYFKGVKFFFFTNFLLLTCMAGIEFIIPVLYGKFIEEVIIAQKIQLFLPIVIGYLIIFLIKTGMLLLKTHFNNKIQNKIVYSVKSKIWNNLYKKDFFEYEKQNIGDTKMRLEDDVKVLSDLTEMQTIDYLISSVTVVVCVILLFGIEYRLAIFSVICIPITFFFDRLLSKEEMVLNNEQRENDKSQNTWLYNSISGWREIKALNLQNKQKLTFIGYIKKYAMYYAKWINYWTLRVLIIPKLRKEFCMQFGLYFIGGILIINNEFSIGSLLIFAMYFSILSDSISKVSSIDASLQGQKPYYERLFEELNTDNSTLVEYKIAEEDLFSIKSISLEKVTYHYPHNEKNILNNFSLTLLSGDKLAIVGESGCGKSTILKLLSGILKPCDGQILCNNEPLTNENFSKLYKHIGYIMQDSYLFDDTITNNLRLGKENATMKELENACRMACIYDEIIDMPKQFETTIGEHGKRLSGGQRQRLILARTFLRDVDIIILDEATSALDVENEIKITKAMENIGEDKIVIAVAHRESALTYCNRRLEL